MSVTGLLLIICFSRPVFLIDSTTSGIMTVFSILFIITAMSIFRHTGELIAEGKPTSIKSIEIGKKYKVISITISDEPFEDAEKKVYLLLQKENTENVFFHQRKKGEKPILLPETGDTIILIKDEFIIQKNQK
jgi:hypothetical protein